MAEISGYPMLWRAIEDLEGAARPLPARDDPARGRRRGDAAEHRAILDALRRRDPEGARAAMRAHLDGALRRREYLDTVLEPKMQDDLR